MKKLSIVLAAIASLIAAPALAQRDFPTNDANVKVPGTVTLQCNAALTSCTPTTSANPQPTANNPYPMGATPVAAAQSGAATALSGTLVSAAGQTVYVQGIVVTGAGATAGSVITVTTTNFALGNNPSFKIVVPTGATTSITPLVLMFNPPIPASAVNTNVVVSVPSFGAGNTDASLFVWGYRQ